MTRVELVKELIDISDRLKEIAAHDFIKEECTEGFKISDAQDHCTEVAIEILSKLYSK